MSDFLSNLVERTLTATDAVRPRTLSIFEPPPVSGGAFFRGSEDTDLHPIERNDPEPSNRLSQLQSLWRTTSAEPVAGQFVPAPPNTGPASLQFPSTPSLNPPRGQHDMAAPSGDRGNAERAKTGAREADSSRTESPGASRQMRPRADVRDADQSVARSSRDRATPDRTKTSEESAGSSLSELPGPSPRVRPPVDLARKQRTADSSTERRESTDAVSVSPQVRRAEHPGKQSSGAPLPARRGDQDSADDQDAGGLRTQLPSGKAPSPREPAPRNPTNKHPDGLNPEKVIDLAARERGLHREHVQGRDVRAVSPRPPPSRTLPAAPPAQNPPDAPSINVTIGRVEVRATLPARAPSPAPRATSPIMNLEDYLRERAGGNRP